MISVHPPKGFLIRRQAIVTLDVEDGGVHRQMEQGIPIPRLQAFLWRVAGKVPTPIGRLTDKRDLDAKVWGRSARPPEVALAAQDRSSAISTTEPKTNATAATSADEPRRRARRGCPSRAPRRGPCRARSARG